MPHPASDHLLRTFAAVPTDARVLDADCGDGARVDALATLGFDVFGTDPDKATVARVRASLETIPDVDQRIITARAAALGFPDDYFDWVVADRSHILRESLEETLEILLELRRVMKPGAWLYFVLPVGDNARETTDEECLLGFYRLAAEARFELAEKGGVEDRSGLRVVRAIFRRVEVDTPI